MTDTSARPLLHDETLAAFGVWAQEFGRYGDPITIDALVRCAGQLSGDLRAYPRETAVAEFAPGNATRYVVSVAVLHGHAEAGLGGKHLITLPLQRRSYVLTLVGLWTPDYVKDGFRLEREDDALLYAGVLSLLADRLAFHDAPTL